jgi:hypothetical protein
LILENVLNTTYLFERRDWPPSRESFWTVLFSIFLLYLGQLDESQAKLTSWHANPKGNPWYIKRKHYPELCFNGLEFDDIAVEPLYISGDNFNPNVDIPITLGGVSPDIFVRLNSNYLIIENKIGTTDLNTNQLETYPKLIIHLMGEKINCQYLLVISCGCSDSQFRSASNIQNQIEQQFGFLLWEYIILQMYETKFDIAGNYIAKWQKYTTSLNQDAET